MCSVSNNHVKRYLAHAIFVVFAVCAAAVPSRAWIFVDPTGAPGIDLTGYTQVISDIDKTISRNARNYPAAFALANVGGYPVGDATLGNFPHMFFGVSFTVGCANMKYFDEHIPREKSVYPAYAPNANLLFGFGLAKGFDLLVKALVFSDTMWRPPLNQKSATLKKLNIYSLGAKLRKNLVGEKRILPHFFDFGGFTVSAGVDHMSGIIGVNGQYKYKIATVFLTNPAPGFYNLTLDAYYNFNVKWFMTAANGQAIAYFNFLWIFDIYLGLGMALTWGYIKLDGSGLATVSLLTPGDQGIIRAQAGYKYRPKFVMGLFIAGLEINLWILKLNIETMANISNNRDISVQIGTRFQF